MKVVTQDPDEQIDYEFEFASLLPDGDTITAHTVAASDPDMVVTNVTIAAGVVRAFAAGGTLGNTVELKCQVTTVAGRILVRRTSILIRHR